MEFGFDKENAEMIDKLREKYSDSQIAVMLKKIEN